MLAALDSVVVMKQKASCDETEGNFQSDIFTCEVLQISFKRTVYCPLLKYLPEKTLSQITLKPETKLLIY